jgi:hypothetical protein
MLKLKERKKERECELRCVGWNENLSGDDSNF